MVTAPIATGPTSDVPVGWNPGVETQLIAGNVKWWSYIPDTGGGSVSCAVPGNSYGAGAVPYCFDATVVPEPSTVILLASGLLGIGLVVGWRADRRRRGTGVPSGRRCPPGPSSARSTSQPQASHIQRRGRNSPL